MIPKVHKIGKILYVHLYREKINGTEKWHNKMIHVLPGTHSDQILYLNSVSESEKIEDSKNLCLISRRMEQ